MSSIQKRKQTIAAGVMFALVSVAAIASATAQNFSDRTVFTETVPFEVGSTRLEPGTYLIRVVLLASDRNLVQVTDEQQTKVYASVLATPHPIRPDQAIPANQFLYYAPTAGHPKALRTWFSMNATIGHDIAYPKGRAGELAVAAQVPVPSVAAELKEADFPTAPIEIVEPPPAVAELPAEPPAPVQLADSGGEESLPQGASSVPLLALIGLLSLGAALGFRILRHA